MARSSTQIEKISREDYEATLRAVRASSTIPVNDTPQEQEARKRRALTDYNYFIRTYFANEVDCDCAPMHLRFAKRIRNYTNEILALVWPREHAKSVHANVFMPLWLLVNNLLTGVVVVGKNLEDACNQLADIQVQLEGNELFGHDFGDYHNAGDWAEGDFTTRSGIRFKALGRDMSPLGLRKGKFRPNYAVLDDLDDDEILQNPKRIDKVINMIFGGLLPALQTKQWWMVVANNRRAPAGILGNIIGDVKPGAPIRDNVWVDKVPAILDENTPKERPAWERYTLKEIRDKGKAMGHSRYRREFFHEYMVEGKIFKDSYFAWAKPKPLTQYKVIVGYIDPSFENNATSDFKAAAVIGLDEAGGAWRRTLLKAICRRCSFQELFELLAAYEDNLPDSVNVIWYIEQQFFNGPIRDALDNFNRGRKRKLYIITDTRNKENKYTRIVRMEPLFSQGKYLFNANEMYNPDYEEMVNQLKGIEPGYRGSDDGPDAIEGAEFIIRQHEVMADLPVRIGKRNHARRAY